MIIIERYRYFDSGKEYEEYLSKVCLKKIGAGREGMAFLTKDGEAIKKFVGNWYDPAIHEEGEKDSIIMAEDYNVSTYLFPKQLFILNNIIVGYISDYFPNNIIKCSKPYNGNIKDINVDNLLESYYKMVDDTKEISKDKVSVYDMTFNILFDNHNLAAIDTFNYFKADNKTLEANLKALDFAILHELHYHDYRYVPNYGKSVEYNLKRIKK